MSHRFSVTEVRNALRCPRSFALGRHLGAQVGFPIGASSMGSAFHRIVEALARTVGNPPPAVAAARSADELSAGLARWLVDLLIRELDENPAYATMPSEIDDLAEALRRFAAYVARAAGGGGAEALRAFFDSAELTIELAIELGGATVLIAGRIDAIHVHPTEGAQVVEYKLTDDVNEDIDRAQVALYRHLVQEVRGVAASAVILRFNPELTSTTLDPAAAEALMGRRIRPLIAAMVGWADQPALAPATPRTDLCSVCPVRRACAETYRDRLPPRDDPPSSAARPRPEPSGALRPAGVIRAESDPSPVHDPEAAAEAAELKEAILSVLRARGLSAECRREPLVGARVIKVEVGAPRGSITKVDRAAEDVRHHLHVELGRTAEYRQEGGLRFFSVERKQPREVRLLSLLERAGADLAARPGRFVLGERLDGRPLVGDLGDASSAHLLIGGRTGSGKSVLLRSIAASLVHFHSPSAIRLTLVDPKRVSFQRLASSLGSHLARPICLDADECLAILEDLVDEMQERYRMFEEAGVSDVSEYNEGRPEAEGLPRHVVLFDEFQDLLAAKDSRASFVHGVTRLGAMARAAGIHLILATQRPTKDTVPTTLKANLGGKVALQVTSQLESRVILDQNGAEKLLGKGDLLASLGGEIVRAQAPLG